MIASLITAVHLAALSQIESGDNNHAIGKAGEVSRYQIMPEAAEREVRENAVLRGRPFHAGWAVDESLARAVALGIWEKRVAVFRLVYRREPTVEELYLCWHRPARVLNPKPRELARAVRFANLFKSLSHE